MVIVIIIVVFVVVGFSFHFYVYTCRFLYIHIIAHIFTAHTNFIYLNMYYICFFFVLCCTFFSVRVHFKVLCVITSKLVTVPMYSLILVWCSKYFHGYARFLVVVVVFLFLPFHSVVIVTIACCCTSSSFMFGFSICSIFSTFLHNSKLCWNQASIYLFYWHILQHPSQKQRNIPSWNCLFVGSIRKQLYFRCEF